MGADRTRIPWLRVLVEGAVIVGSILLAFAIDAGWQRAQENRRGRELVESMREDFSETSRLLGVAIESAAENRDRSREYMTIISEGREVTADSLAVLYRSIGSVTFFEPVTTSYHAALQSGDIALIRNSALLRALTDFDRGLDSYELHLRLSGELFYLGAVQDLRGVVGSLRAPGSPADSPLRALLPPNFDLRSRAAVSALEPVATIHQNLLRAFQTMKQASDEVVGELDRTRH